MRRSIAVLFLLNIFFNTTVLTAQTQWTRVNNANKEGEANTPAQGLTYAVSESTLKTQLLNTAASPAKTDIIELPMADGSIQKFRMKAYDLLPRSLATKYPGLNTFSAISVEDPAITAKLDITAFGFHAMIYDGEHTAFIDPSGNGVYHVVYKKDVAANPAQESRECLVKQNAKGEEEQMIDLARKTAAKTVVNGTQLRIYRIAISCSHQYAQAATGITNPTIVQAMSKIVTSLNRINGIYEKDLSITMTLVANEDTLIFPTATGSMNGADPFSSSNSSASECNLINQQLCTQRIGTANYDLGHVFTSGAGGYSQVGAVCFGSLKAQSSTGRPSPVGDDFDLDFVAHEIGHQFGANHTFNNGKSNSCGGDNRYQKTAYEPGSGSTIMAYAGICSPDNIQKHSDDYFHSVSLLEIEDFVTNGGGRLCGVKTATGITPPVITSFTRSYNIPFLTPFELIAPVASAGDASITYCWEQWSRGIDDAGNIGNTLTDTKDIGPIFRSFAPVSSSTRIFPRIDMVLAGKLSDAGTDNVEGEKVPDVERFLAFKLTVRNKVNTYGAFLFSDDSILLNARNTGTGFVVTSQNTTGNIFNGNSTQNITWDVVKTNEFPISTPNVDIDMSADGGYTWPYHIGTYINNGSAFVTLPNPDTTITKARIKVKGTDNVFFNINRENFGVVHSDVEDTVIELHPSPARNVLRVSSGNKGDLQMVVYDALGQQMWKGHVNGELDIRVTYWARGMYFIVFIDDKGGRTVKKFVVQ